MKEQFTNSLVISTYNRPAALELCLLSILEQKVLPDEIIIADDGSSENTKNLIDSYKKKFAAPVYHVWHHDEGFRKTIILNQAIRQSKGDYIIQIDGDIIIHPSFVQEHLYEARPGYFIRGSRTSLNSKKTNKLLHSKKIYLHFLSGGIINRFNAFYNKFFSKINFLFSNPNLPGDVIGCNMSFYKNDFIKVNGYNNDITGWGREDIELAARFINSGILKKSVKYRAVCFHLHHSLCSREHDERNMSMVKYAINHKVKYCVNGYAESTDG